MRSAEKITGVVDRFGGTRVGKFFARPLIAIAVYTMPSQSENIDNIRYDASTHSIDISTPEGTTAFKHGKQYTVTMLYPWILGFILMGSFGALATTFPAGTLVYDSLSFLQLFFAIGSIASLGANITINGEEVDADG